MPWRESFCGSQYEQMEIRDLIIKCMLKNDIKFYTKAEKIEHGSQLLLRQEQLYQCEGKNLAQWILLIWFYVQIQRCWEHTVLIIRASGYWKYCITLLSYGVHTCWSQKFKQYKQWENLGNLLFSQFHVRTCHLNSKKTLPWYFH